MVAGSGLEVAGAELVAAGICRCRKVIKECRKAVAGSILVVTGAGLVAAGICWCRKVVAGAELVAAGAELVAAGAGKWSLVQDWKLLVQEGDSWCRTGSRWCLLVQESSRWFRTGSCWFKTGGYWYLLVQEGSYWCRTGSCWGRTGNHYCRKVASAWLVAAGAELVAAGICWCRKMVTSAGLVAASAGKWPLVQEWQLLLQ